MKIDGIELGAKINDCFEFSKFPSGEIKVEFDYDKLKNKRTNNFYYEMNVFNSDEIMKMYFASKRMFEIVYGMTCAQSGYIDYAETCTYNLYIPYLPYSRQDRVTLGSRENLICINTLKYFSELINEIKFDWIITLDAHSDKSFNYIRNLKSPNIFDSISRDYLIDKTICIPDEGARTRLKKSKFYYNDNMVYIYFNKKRSEVDGKLSVSFCHGSIEKLSCSSNRILVVDDICDGGGTFIMIAKEIRKVSKLPLELYVSNGIFSKGKEDLYKYYDKITCINEVKQ